MPKYKDTINQVKGKVVKECYKVRDGQNDDELIWEAEKNKIIPIDMIVSYNTWLTTGWNEILKIISGQSTSTFNSTRTQIAIGTDSTAAAIGQTGLLGTTTAFKTVYTGYPTTPSAGEIDYRAYFTTSEGNFNVQELIVYNTLSGIAWDRVANNWGVKGSDEIWRFTVTLGTS